MTRRVVTSALTGVLSVGALLGGGCSGDEYVAPPPATRSDAADPTVATATLAALRDALDDPGAAADLGADDQSADLLAALARNATALRLEDVSLGYVTETGATDGDDGWDGLVSVSWRVDGFDRAAARTEVAVSFDDGGRTIAGVAAAERRPRRTARAGGAGHGGGRAGGRGPLRRARSPCRRRHPAAARPR
ncbi:hypothetical protein L615_001900000570 [Nocardioides sp. J9]|uniref:hypothetical protein n=1 Tax=Nocardioides sp. J9 TaxID=935844 RepID=UPI0011A0CF00|nr:hypothetical protein [Nocardioides sp. J9]TWH01376.1 hypothetical protein L615_001900000570 [Nocardioides sp. J9]